ncbi:2297_t:CDS:2, partial [Diversispora eburnea]
TCEYVSHICYKLRPVPISQGPPGPFYNGLTPTRERALVEFNEKVLKLGCNLKNLHILENDEKDGGLGMKIIVKDILSNKIWNSRDIPEMPKISSICGMDLECERALASACTKTKERKVNIDDKKIVEALISFVTRELPKATRVWIIGKEILTYEGILYRSSHEWEKLIKAFEYKKSQFIPEELLKWGPVDIRRWMEGGYYYSSTLIPSQELKAKYNELEKFLGVESMVWNASIDSVPKYIHIDLREAYLGYYLLSAGWLISVTSREIIYSVGKKSYIEFSPNRDLAVCFYEGDKKRAQWLHIHSFILAYTHIAILEQLKCFPIENVLRVCTNAIYTTAIPETILDESKLEIDFDKELFANAKNDIELEEVNKRYDAKVDKIKKQYESVIVLDTLKIKYGQWCKKKPGYIYRKEASSWTINHKSSLDFPPSETPPLSTDPKLITLQKSYLVGQGGSKKITRAICAFSNRKIVDPACLGKKTLAEILIFDEACMILRKTDKVIWCMEDYRAQDDKLKALKLRMQVESTLLQAHASHFLNEPSVICFDPDDSIKHKYRIQGKPIQIP